MVNPIAEVFELIGYTTEVALGDPIAAVLILIANLLLGGSILVFFGLAIGGILDTILPDQIGRSPPPQER
ncbi:hypothetical protein [Halalkalicoccus tibetensis]|uniref:Uncharacterized protein n=1 Tax=Halalkalicoccus tibetensis TaxID=175632 RepID=A0ABD5V6J5_9EURY